MTTDGTHAIMSDGTDKLTYLLPPGMKPVKTINVTENGIPVKFINELEWIKGYIFANVWQTNYIIKIDPTSGKVKGKMDLTSVSYTHLRAHETVLDLVCRLLLEKKQP